MSGVPPLPPPGANMPKKRDPRLRGIQAPPSKQFFDSADYEVRKQQQQQANQQQHQQHRTIPTGAPHPQAYSNPVAGGSSSSSGNNSPTYTQRPHNVQKGYAPMQQQQQQQQHHRPPLVPPSSPPPPPPPPPTYYD